MNNNNLIEIFVYKYFQNVQNKGLDLFVPCCFHKEDTPSLSINKETAMFHCFGCNANGSFKDLKKKFGVVDDEYTRVNNSMTAKIWDDTKKKLNGDVENNYEGRNYYRDLPYGYKRITEDDFNTKYYHYLQEREITYNTVKTFKMGYTAEKNSKFYGRIVVPVHDEQGKYAFPECRLVGEGDRKYLRPFKVDCKQFLFNYHRVKNKKYVIITEGIFDAISLYQWGYSAVCSFNPVLSDRQVKLLLNFNKIFFSFDNDEAGNNGLRNAVKVLKHKGIQLYQIKYQKGQDANSIGLEKFKQLLNNADVINYFMEVKRG